MFFPEESLISSVYLRLLLVFPELYCAGHVWSLTPLHVCVCESRAERVYQRLRNGKWIRASVSCCGKARASGRCDAALLAFSAETEIAVAVAPCSFSADAVMLKQVV